MKAKLDMPLEHFNTPDLKRLASILDMECRGLNRKALLDMLYRESASVLKRAVAQAIDNPKLGLSDEEAETRDGQTQTETKDDEAMREEFNVVKEGVARFAEHMEQRLATMEQEFALVTRNVAKRIAVCVPDEQGKLDSEKARVVFEGAVHREFEKLLTMAKAKCNILMVGPAGSGKTTAAEQLSQALGVPFRFNGAIDTEYKLKGFVDAQGRVVNTAFREAFENGGVYLFDEVDASLPAATMAFNAALANGWCDFPDGRVNRHKDTVIIAAANTYMGGATFEYVGRNKQDAAFADRFVVLRWDIDEALEMELCSQKQWCAHVQTLRSRAASKGLKVIISPRASIEGAKLLAAGLSWEDVESAAVRKGMTDDQWLAIAR